MVLTQHCRANQCGPALIFQQMLTVFTFHCHIFHGSVASFPIVLYVHVNCLNTLYVSHKTGCEQEDMTMLCYESLT